jgi:hypothetical protein
MRAVPSRMAARKSADAHALLRAIKQKQGNI